MFTFMLSSVFMPLQSSFVERAHPGYFKANPRQRIIWPTFAQFSSDQSCRSVVSFRRSILSDSATPWTAAWQVPLSITNSEFSQTHVHRVSDAIHHLILCRPLLFLPSIFPGIRVFSNESALCIRWTKYWSFSFSISPSNEHPGLISFGMDWLDLQYSPRVRTCFYENKTTINSLNKIKTYFLMSFHNLNVITPNSLKNVFLLLISLNSDQGRPISYSLLMTFHL